MPVSVQGLVGVGVFVALPEVTITSSGRFVPASRLAKLMFVLLVVLKAKLNCHYKKSLPPRSQREANIK
jgi:hypothetical protein